MSDSGAAVPAHEELKKALGPITLWGLGVGYVISGMYFGWNLGLPEGGPYGMLVATLLTTLLYVTFTFGYAELACAMPRAGGTFVYAGRALGPRFAVVGGIAQWVEFVFAPPAIALAIGAYLALFFPGISPFAFALGAYVLFTGVNVIGVKLSAAVELVVTVLAVGELLVFAGVTAPHVSMASFTANALPHGWWGILPALPYAIWFYLGIEGVANVAEEAKNPSRNIPLGFGSAMATLVVLTLLTFGCAVAVSGWESVVFKPGSTETSDSPLPLALSHIVGPEHVAYKLLVGIGLFGLIASFHGLVLASGRATFELGRAGYAPRPLGRILHGRQTPAIALVANLVCGVIAMASGRTEDVINLSVFGALTMYAAATISLIVLRRREPTLERPFLAPFYPAVPVIALSLTLLCLASMVWFHPRIALLFCGIVAAAFVSAALFGAKVSPETSSSPG